MFSRCSPRIVSNIVLQRSSRVVHRVTTGGTGTCTVRPNQARWMSVEKEAAAEAAKAEVKAETKTGWWSDAKFWGGLGALAGWGMSGSAIYDAAQQGPEVISLTMTPVLIVYSTLFARWAYVVTPPNPLLMYCHIANVAAQLNQLRRALEFKMNNGEEEQVHDLMKKVAVGGAVAAVSVAAGPTMQSALTGASLGIISEVAAAQAGTLRSCFLLLSAFPTCCLFCSMTLSLTNLLTSIPPWYLVHTYRRSFHGAFLGTNVQVVH